MAITPARNTKAQPGGAINTETFKIMSFAQEAYFAHILFYEHVAFG
jgi:hypothetical protein